MKTKIGSYSFERHGHAGVRIHYDNGKTGGVSLGVHSEDFCTSCMIAALCETVEMLQAEVAELRKELREALSQ